MAAVQPAIARGLVREVEVYLAGLALWALERVQAGTLAPDAADRLFTHFDLATDRLELSDDAGDLLLECHSFHHWGGEHSTDPAKVHELAERILARASGAPTAG